MAIVLNQIKLPISENESSLPMYEARALAVPAEAIRSIRVTLVFALLTGPVSYVLCFLLAWLINELPPKLKTIFTLKLSSLLPCMLVRSIRAMAIWISTARLIC